MARASASIPESTKTYVGSMFKREHLRSITVVFGIGEERAFYFEKNPSLLIERLRHNMTFFYLNYMIFTAILFCLTLFVSPSAIIGILLLAGAWMWVIRASADGSLKIGSKCDHSTSVRNARLNANHRIAGISIPQKTATLLMAVVSVFVLIYLLSGIFWLTLFWSGFLTVAHALFRDASMHKDMGDAVAMEGDLNLAGEDATFLNTARVDQV